MSFRPDQLFLQLFTLLYFCSWLWLSLSAEIIPVRDFAWRSLGVIVGLVLVANALLWGYLVLLIVILTAWAK